MENVVPTPTWLKEHQCYKCTTTELSGKDINGGRVPK